MQQKRESTLKETIKTVMILNIILFPGILFDIVYWSADKRWLSCGMVSVLRRWNITYNNAFDILGGNFGVIVTMFSMFLSINNNISERFEKKVYGIPRAELYPDEGIYRYFKRMCLLAPVLMLLFLNLKFCVSGYLVFGCCVLFLLWYYYRHVSSFSKPLTEMVCKLKSYLPKESEWTEENISEYQILLENIGKSAEEDGNWKEIEILYDELCESTREYDTLKRYLISLNFYRIVFWKREKRNQIIPMEMLRRYLRRLDRTVGEEIHIPEQEWSVLWAMLRVAVCEADEGELINFLQWFYDFSDRSSNAMEKTKIDKVSSEILEEQAGMLIVLLEYRVRQQLPESVQLIEQLREAWKRGVFSFLFEGYEFKYRINLYSQNLFEEDRNILEMCMENLEEDYYSRNKKSLIANLI